MYALEVPESLAGRGIEGEDGVGVEIVADAVAAVEVEYRGARRSVDDSAFGVERHPCPVVGCAGGLPCIFGPGFVAGLSRMRDGVEAPGQFAGAHVEGADVSRWRGMRLRIAAADDDEVLVDDAGRGQDDGLLFVVAA